MLTIYAEESAVDVATPERIGYAIEAFDPFWGNDMAIYFLSPATVLQFVDAFPDVELADGVERAGLD